MEELDRDGVTSCNFAIFTLQQLQASPALFFLVFFLTVSSAAVLLSLLQDVTLKDLFIHAIGLDL